ANPPLHSHYTSILSLSLRSTRHRSASTSSLVFFFADPPPTATYTLSLHDALPILPPSPRRADAGRAAPPRSAPAPRGPRVAGGTREGFRPRRRRAARRPSAPPTRASSHAKWRRAS